MKTFDQRLSFYREIYYKEVDRRKDFNNAIIIPITLLTGVFSILFYLISAYTFNNWHWLDYGFILIFSIALGLFIISAFYTLRFYSNIDSGFKTIELPSPDEIEQYRKQLWEHYANESEAEDIFLDWLINEYIKTSVNYQKNNDLKALHFFQFKKYFTYGLIGLFVSGIGFVQNFLTNQHEKVEKLNIYVEIQSPYLKNDVVSIDTTINKEVIKNDSLQLTLKARK